MMIGIARIEAASGPMYLYWGVPAYFRYAAPRWILEGNAGVVATHHRDYLETLQESTIEITPADEALQAEIDEIIGRPANRPIEEARMGTEARELAAQWGWL